MKAWFRFFIFFLLLFSCKEKCGKNLDCTIKDPFIEFKIFDILSQKDLFFDSIPNYNIEDLKIFDIINSDTIFYPVSIKSKENDSFFSTKISFKEKLLFVQISSSDVDTLSLTYHNSNLKCCPYRTTLNVIFYNKNGFEPTFEKGYVSFFK